VVVLLDSGHPFYVDRAVHPAEVDYAAV